LRGFLQQEVDDPMPLAQAIEALEGIAAEAAA